MGILQVESTGWWHAPLATAWGCFSCRYTPTQSFLCTYYCVYIFQHSRMVFVVYVSKNTQQSRGSGLWCSKGGLRSCTGSWVDILCGCLRCHLYDPWFVNDASSAVSFLYNSDDPRLVALAVFWGFDLGTEAGGLLPRQTDEQASCKDEEILSVTRGSNDIFIV